MSPLLKNLLILLVTSLIILSISPANATLINLPEEVKCMIKNRTKCMIC
jgi:hypothetical protein